MTKVFTALPGRALLCALGLVACLGLLPDPAQALTLPLTFEFDDGVEGDYGTVVIEEDGAGGIFFEVSLGPDLGPDADLHYFYFNLSSNVPDLVISSDDPVATVYGLAAGSSVRGGAGSSFDYAVFFGNGAGPPGNGTLQTATFTLSSTSTDLSLADFFELSSTSQGLESNFAAHVQSTSTRAGSETVGAVVPEPTTLGMMVCGLLGLAAAGRRSA
jgi:hypothetical protein